MLLGEVIMYDFYPFYWWGKLWMPTDPEVASSAGTLYWNSLDTCQACCTGPHRQLLKVRGWTTWLFSRPFFQPRGVCGQRHLPLACNCWILLGKHPGIPYSSLHFHSHRWQLFRGRGWKTWSEFTAGNSDSIKISVFNNTSKACCYGTPHTAVSLHQQRWRGLADWWWL